MVSKLSRDYREIVTVTVAQVSDTGIVTTDSPEWLNYSKWPDMTIGIVHAEPGQRLQLGLDKDGFIRSSVPEDPWNHLGQHPAAAPAAQLEPAAPKPRNGNGGMSDMIRCSALKSAVEVTSALIAAGRIADRHEALEYVLGVETEFRTRLLEQ